MLIKVLWYKTNKFKNLFIMKQGMLVSGWDYAAFTNNWVVKWKDNYEVYF